MMSRLEFVLARAGLARGSDVRYALERADVPHEGDRDRRDVWRAWFTPKPDGVRWLVGEFPEEEGVGYQRAWDAALDYHGGKNPDRLPFDFRFAYFKPGGKPYSSAVRRVHVKTSGDWGRPIHPYMPDLVEYVAEVRSGVLGPPNDHLPGLAGRVFNGHVLVTPVGDVGYSVLIPYERPGRAGPGVIQSVNRAVEAHRNAPDTFFI